MNVTYIGFGGTMDVPCYKDEKGNLYFDVNDGKNGLNLYSGACLTSYGEILYSNYSAEEIAFMSKLQHRCKIRYHKNQQIDISEFIKHDF